MTATKDSIAIGTLPAFIVSASLCDGDFSPRPFEPETFALDEYLHISIKCKPTKLRARAESFLMGRVFDVRPESFAVKAHVECLAEGEAEVVPARLAGSWVATMTRAPKGRTWTLSSLEKVVGDAWMALPEKFRIGEASRLGSAASTLSNREDEKPVGARDYSQALRRYDEAVAMYPAHRYALIGRARLRAQTGDYAGALDDYARYASLLPDPAARHSSVHDGDIALDAVEAFRFACQDRHGQASADAWSLLIERWPDLAEARLHRADEYYHLENWSAAEADLRRYEELGGQSAHALRIHGNCLLALQRHQEAIAFLENAVVTLEALHDVPRGPGDPPDPMLGYKSIQLPIMYRELALALAGTGGDVEAIAALSKAIELAPKYGRAYFERGEAELRQKNRSATLEDWKKAASLKFGDAIEALKHV